MPSSASRCLVSKVGHFFLKSIAPSAVSSLVVSEQHTQQTTGASLLSHFRAGSLLPCWVTVVRSYVRSFMAELFLWPLRRKPQPPLVQPAAACTCYIHQGPYLLTPAYGCCCVQARAAMHSALAGSSWSTHS
jgi:hypothetical protein